jgi:hypothetical protein
VEASLLINIKSAGTDYTRVGVSFCFRAVGLLKGVGMCVGQQRQGAKSMTIPQPDRQRRRAQQWAAVGFLALPTEGRNLWRTERGKAKKTKELP